MSVGADKAANVAAAEAAVARAAAAGARIVVLPEMWNCPYENKSFPVYAEAVPSVGGSGSSSGAPAGSTAAALSAMAARHGIYLVGGSIPERDGTRMYNTCLVHGPRGELVAKHRKVHLFDIDVPGQYFKESDTLSAGNQITTFDTDFGVRVGVGICTLTCLSRLREICV
jgi:omega-amidase